MTSGFTTFPPSSRLLGFSTREQRVDEFLGVEVA
jgi:hypothetical protein